MSWRIFFFLKKIKRSREFEDIDPTMPKRRRVTKRKRRARRGRSKRTVAKLTKRIGFPQSSLVRLRYAEIVGINAGVGETAFGIYNFRANDVYDPNFSSGGHQPNCYDQWTAIYQKHTVVGSKIKVTMTSVADTQIDCFAGVRTVTESTAPTTYTQLMEAPGKKPNIWTAAQDKTIVTSNYSHRKWFGRFSTRDDHYYGGPASSPPETVFHQIYVGALDPTSDAPNIQCMVVIEYLVLFFDPIVPLQS